MKDAAKLHHFPLKQAWLCLDCDHIGNSACWCPACMSTHLLGLSKVLNRVKEEEELVK